MEGSRQKGRPLATRGGSRDANAARPSLYAVAGATAAPVASNAGTVYLVGAGPGNPDLLTLRAAKVIALGDVIVYDRLVGDGILALARPGAQRIYVGKARSNHTLPQDAICALLLRLALEGKEVVRLKGGDPFVFGRGGEETELLAAHGIPFEVVPGITAANGIAAYAGIPLTHRDYAHAVVLVTGHLRDGTMDLDWAALARPRQTVVVYMGLLGLPILCHELVVHGLPTTTPAAIVQQGTTAQQRVVVGTLADLPGRAFDARLSPPTLIIVGEVVRLRDKLGWFQPEANATVARSAARGVAD